MHLRPVALPRLREKPREFDSFKGPLFFNRGLAVNQGSSMIECVSGNAHRGRLRPFAPRQEAGTVPKTERNTCFYERVPNSAPLIMGWLGRDRLRC
jgi:hypothetical protein